MNQLFTVFVIAIISYEHLALMVCPEDKYLENGTSSCFCNGTNPHWEKDGDIYVNQIKHSNNSVELLLVSNSNESDPTFTCCVNDSKTGLDVCNETFTPLFAYTDDDVILPLVIGLSVSIGFVCVAVFTAVIVLIIRRSTRRKRHASVRDRYSQHSANSKIKTKVYRLAQSLADTNSHVDIKVTDQEKDTTSSRIPGSGRSWSLPDLYNPGNTVANRQYSKRQQIRPKHLSVSSDLADCNDDAIISAHLPHLLFDVTMDTTPELPAKLGKQKYMAERESSYDTPPDRDYKISESRDEKIPDDENPYVQNKPCKQEPLSELESWHAQTTVPRFPIEPSEHPTAHTQLQIPLENLTAHTQLQIPLEHPTDQYDRTIEHSTSLNNQSEILSQYSTSLYNQHEMPLQHSTSLYNQHEMPLEHSTSLYNQHEMPLEHSTSLYNQHEMPLEHPTSLYNHHEMPLEHSTSLYNQHEIPLEHPTSLYNQHEIPLEHPTSLYNQHEIPLEHPTSLYNQHEMPLQQTTSLLEILPIEQRPVTQNQQEKNICNEQPIFLYNEHLQVPPQC